MRERHSLIAHSAPKAMRPSKWDQEYDAPKLPKIRTGVVKAEDVSGKFDQFLTKAAGKKSHPRIVVSGDDDDGVRSNISSTSSASGFKSDWSKRMQQKQSPHRKQSPMKHQAFHGHGKKFGMHPKPKQGGGKFRKHNSFGHKPGKNRH